MPFFLLPQKLLTGDAAQHLHALLWAQGGVPVTSGWSPSPALAVDGWLFPKAASDTDFLYTRTDVPRFFAQAGTGWVDVPVHPDGSPLFWPVAWHHHTSEGATVWERTVFDRARRAGWFDSPYRHAPTAHESIAAQAQGQRLTPPPLPR
jgi:hypothetical protein